MTSSAHFRFATPFLAVVFCAGVAMAGAPVVPLDLYPEAVATDLTAGVVTPIIPTTKVLVFPVTAYDPDNGRLTITATSDNPAVTVRVRTGNALLRLTVNHNANPNSATDVAYSGDLVFQLFRQVTPETVGFISGFAESGFYDASTFHRLADLNSAKEAANITGIEAGWIYQGGSPNGDPTKGPGFAYDNEPDRSLIFSGRGMLAMANSAQGATHRGTNGSQFFITDGRVTLNSDGKTIKTDGRIRDLNFGYTIFGQMTHGWPLLDNLKNTPTGTPTAEKPNVDVTITNATMLDQYMDAAGHVYTDASLFLSATEPTDSTKSKMAHITVTFSDNQTPPHTTTKTFRVEALNDTINDPPFFLPVANQEVAAGKDAVLHFGIIDLERDFVGNFNRLITSLSSTIANTDSSGSTPGFSEIVNNDTAAIFPISSSTGSSAPFTGPMDLVLEATQYDMTYRGAIDGNPPGVDSFGPSTIAFGDSPINPIPVTITGTTGVQISNAVVAKYQTASTRSQTGDISASINWGDGVTSADPTTAIAPDGGTLGRYQMLGSHVYTRPGIYQVQVTFGDAGTNGKSINGLSATALSTAIITSGAIKPVGRTIDVSGRETGKITLATFTDTSGTPGSYTAQIDWGDGLLSNGAIVKSASGTYSVTGSHTYVDPETFAVLVRVKKTGDTNAADSVSAWSTINVSGFTGPAHLPPYDQAHLVAIWTPVSTSKGVKYPTKSTLTTATTSQTYLTYRLFILNAGNVKSKLGSLSCYLSLDKTYNAKAGTNSDGSPNPADIPLSFGPNPNRTKVAILPLQPGEALEYTFVKNGLGDVRLTPPQNKWIAVTSGSTQTMVPTDVTTGTNLLAVMDYSDPIADNEPIGKTAVVGSVDGILLNGLVGTAPTLTTTQDVPTAKNATNTNTVSYSVKLDRKPTQLVNITFTVSNSNEGGISSTKPQDTTGPQSTQESADSNATVTFDSTNWNTPQMIYVSGIPNDDSTATSYSISAAVTSTDPYFNGMQAPAISVSNQLSLFAITPLNLILYRTPNTFNTATFSVKLAQTPGTTVTLPVTSSNEAGTVDKTSLSFSPSLAKTPQVVTVSAASTAQTGVVTYQIDLGPAAAPGDSRYDQLQPPAVTVVTEDYPFVITPNPLTVYRTPNQTTPFTVALSMAPTATVSIPVNVTATDPTSGATINPAGSVDVDTLVFTPSNYATPQTVNVTYSDTIGSGTPSYTVKFGPVSSADINYNGAPVLNLSATNKDDPILVSGSPLVTTETNGGPPPTTTFTVALANPPTDTVTIPVASSNPKEGTVDQAILTFTPANYATPQTVTVTGAEDMASSGKQIVYQVTLGPAQSTDPKYNGVPGPSATVTNVNY